MARNGHLEIFSRPQVMENSRQYLLLRTDILQKTVVECPWLVYKKHHLEIEPFSLCSNKFA